MINRISVLLFVCLSGFLINPVQSLAYAGPADSLKVRTINGKKYMLHKVQPKETWSLLSKKYNIPVEELIAANNGVEVIKIDQIVNIPLSTANTAQTTTSKSTVPAVEKANTNSSQPSGSKTPVTHTVMQGETLFGIAKKYNQPVDKIKEYNKLSADGIKTGQKLIVNYVGNSGNQVIAQTEVQKVVVPPASPKPATSTASTSTTPVAIEDKPEPEPAKAEAIMNAEATSKMDQKFFDKPTKSVTTIKKGNGSKSMVQVTETGVATWIQDGNNSGKKFYGLHRTAPIGTIMKVTNRMNNLSVYVKIVGVLPDTGDNDNLIIKMSQAVSEKLNALDTFFQVELSYGIME